MRSRLVLKLFLLTAALCTIILAAVYALQTLFFKDFYISRKVNDLKQALGAYASDYASGDGSETIGQLEQELYTRHNAWATVLDANGSIAAADRFGIYVKAYTNDGETSNLWVPLTNLVAPEEAASSDFALQAGSSLLIEGFRRDDVLIPIQLQMINGAGGQTWTNDVLSGRANDADLKRKRDEDSQQAESGAVNVQTDPPYVTFKAVVTVVHLPSSTGPDQLLYANELFLSRINEFQANLLLGEGETPAQGLQTTDLEQSGIRYKLFVLPMTDSSGHAAYLFAMSSLQPVDEAARMLRDYYGYVIGFAVLLVLLASSYYARTIARPLLRINQTTKRLASLDFTAELPASSADEIGELSRNINSLSGSLQRHIRQLEQDIEMEKRLENTRKEFIAGVSHELKTPLSVLKSCISILRDGVASHKRDHYFQAMDQEVERMDLLVVDMLDLAKLESGTYALKKETFRVDRLVMAVCDSLALPLKQKQLQLLTRLAPVTAEGNPHRIEQVLANFLTNAIRHSPEGGTIAVMAEEQEDRVLVCVKNKGDPIPPDQLDKVWDRFYRGEASRRRDQGGTGLGLAIARNILELHGSSYGAANTKDGVIFHFDLRRVPSS
ncbi:sensor histidine kinase [Cohnella zeiphila]|uniref:histidine kinase n=1 Tax=Cohnella zeiphila TaxID=2761120 RepID=A0A7X0SME7_9BACL|nr:HAMP domain-containing sensor histidine kinase [Cohnella zeiphila]MBB6730443.1 HAMP domain-containing protein [Cohnella zeiphila]